VLNGGLEKSNEIMSVGQADRFDRVTIDNDIYLLNLLRGSNPAVDSKHLRPDGIRDS